MNIETLMNDNYIILNGKITSVSCKFEEGKFNLSLLIQGDGWQCIYGNFNIFDKNVDIVRSLTNLLNVAEVDDINDLKDKYVRIAARTAESPVEYIGHIVADIWYNYEEYNKEEEYEKIDVGRLENIWNG